MDVDAAQMPAAAQLQMTLPMRHGGLGLFKLTPEASEAAYLTCAAQAHAVLTDAAQPLRPFDGTRGEQLQQRWTTLVRAVDGVPGSEDFKPPADCVWTEEQRAPTEVVIEKAMPQAQREVNRHQQDTEHARLMLMFDTADPHSLEGAQAAARIRSCSGGAASAYLEVLPIAHNLRIANSHLTWELRFRLGIQVMPSSSAGGAAPAARCCAPRATRTTHWSAPKNSGVRTLRHDHLNRVWCGAARCAGVATAVEPKLRALQMQPGVRRHAQARGDARGDALLAMPEGMLVLDVNIVHAPAVRVPRGDSGHRLISRCGWRGSGDRGEGQGGQVTAATSMAALYEWVPVVMESGGRLGKGSMRVLSRLATITAESNGVEKHVFVRRAQEALSVARVRGNGYVWKRGLHAMGLWRRPMLPNWSRSAHQRSGLIVHADVVMTSVSIASRLACSAP